jgi:hypothetical protein
VRGNIWNDEPRARLAPAVKLQLKITDTKDRQYKYDSFKMIVGLKVDIVLTVCVVIPGTHDIHALILGRAITGIQSFTVQ